jgi:hypothetical protein
MTSARATSGSPEERGGEGSGSPVRELFNFLVANDQLYPSTVTSLVRIDWPGSLRFQTGNLHNSFFSTLKTQTWWSVSM